MAANPLGDPFLALVFLAGAGLLLFFLVLAGLCVMALFLPVILVVAGLLVLVARKSVPLPMNVRLLVGFGLILIGALWLGFSW